VSFFCRFGKEVGSYGVVALHSSANGIHPAQPVHRFRIPLPCSLAIELDGFGWIPRDSLAMLKGASEFAQGNRIAGTLRGDRYRRDPVKSEKTDYELSLPHRRSTQEAT
jgi:hypothetical protein